MSKVDKMLKQILIKILPKSRECVSESNLKKIQEMYEALPEYPTGKVAPQWKKTKQTAGTNGENTS